MGFYVGPDLAAFLEVDDADPVWTDVNANKATDVGENGLVGWRVFDDANKDGI